MFEYPKSEIPKTADNKEAGEIHSIGLDMSLPELYVDSEGNTPLYPKPYRKMEKKIAKEQRHLSRMEKDSNNYQKQLAKIAKLHAKAKHQRYDFLHKLSYGLTTQYDLVCIEDLNMAAIRKSLSFGKSTSDNGWGMFTSMLDYKADWYGCTIIRVDKWFPSSKTYCVCGHIHKELKLSDRQYVCPECGHVRGATTRQLSISETKGCASTWRGVPKRHKCQSTNRWNTGASLLNCGAHGCSHAIICHPVKQE